MREESVDGKNGEEDGTEVVAEIGVGLSQPEAHGGLPPAAVHGVPEDLVVEAEVEAEGMVSGVAQQGEQAVDGEIEDDQQGGEGTLESGEAVRRR